MGESIALTLLLKVSYEQCFKDYPEQILDSQSKVTVLKHIHSLG